MDLNDSPEDHLTSIITPDTESLLSLKVGETSVSVLETIVWLPFLLLLVIGWVSIVVVLPPAVASEFMTFTLGWVSIVSGDVSAGTLGSLVGNGVILIVAFTLYTRLYQFVVNLLLETFPE